MRRTSGWPRTRGPVSFAAFARIATKKRLEGVGSVPEITLITSIARRRSKIPSASEIKDPSRLAEMANRVFEARNSAYVAAVELPKSPSQLDAMQKDLSVLRSEFSKAEAGQGSRSSLNHSSPSPVRIYFYHAPFGSCARRCRLPYRWATKTKRSGN